MGAGKATQLQAAKFVKMFPNQGEWLTLLSHKQFLISTFSVHHLVPLLLYKVSHHCAWEEQNVRRLIAWPLASKISHGKSYSHDHACPRTLGIVVRAPLFDLQLHHGTIPCDGGLPGFSVCLELVGPKLQSYRLQHSMWLALSVLLQQVHDELKQ